TCCNPCAPARRTRSRSPSTTAPPPWSPPRSAISPAATSITRRAPRTPPTVADPKPGLSRRRLLGGGAAAVGVAGAAGIGWGAAGFPRAEPERDAATDVVEFYGPHQAGIATPPPGHVTFAGFDLAPEVTRDDIIGLLRIWTDD